jgi:hypothetical protein
LRFYVDSAMLQLALEAKDLDAAASYLQSVDRRAAAFADAYGAGELVKTVRFLCAIDHAEYYLRRRRRKKSGQFGLAASYLQKAEAIASTMERRSIEVQHHIVSVKTKLAVECDDPDWQQYFEQLVGVFQLDPCFEYRYDLQELKRQHENMIPDVPIPGDSDLFIDTMFTHRHPFVLHV